MSIKRIIRESNEGNVLGIQEALKEELGRRIALALEEKKKKMYEGDDEDYEDDEDYGEIEESKKPKTVFASHDGYTYAFRLNGIDPDFYKQPFGRQIDTLKKIKGFTDNAKKYHVGAKGKPTLQSVKNWVKMSEPTQFYARWKSDSDGYKDQSVEVHYTKESVITEQFKRGDIIKVPGADGTEHMAVMVSPTKSFYIPDSEDENLDEVPDTVIKKSTIAKRVSAKHKNFAKEILKNA
jgi:hypothetical protein